MPEKILIVDDDVDTLRLVGIMLQRQGYQIIAASNGNQAIEMAQSENPDLILLDIMMPDVDGFEVTKRLRALPITSTVPIIMFTAKNQVDDKVTGFEVGADDYLTKPTQPRELFAHIKAVLARGRKNRRGTTSPLKEKGLVLGILSAKGGLGLSTLAANLGIVLHNKTNKEVIVAEFRPGEGSISLDLGFTRPESLIHILNRRPTDITSSIVSRELVTHSSGIRLLMSSYLPHDAHYITCAEHFEAIANHLGYLASYAIIDLGPGLTPITERTLKSCEELIVVVEPSPYSIIRTKHLLDDLLERGFGDGRLNIVLINRIRTEMQLTWTQVREQLGKDITVAFTPAPELTYQAAKVNMPLVIQQPDSLSSQQFTKLADTILKHVRQRT